MKKFFILILSLFLVSCSKENEESILNRDQIMDGDFSSILGEYENESGEILELKDEEGFGDPNVQIGVVEYDSEHDIYMIDMHTCPKDSEYCEGGGILFVIPEGVEIEGLETDTSKIRINFGQAYPYEIEEIYYKK